jgi:hypothetical protein
MPILSVSARAVTFQRRSREIERRLQGVLPSRSLTVLQRSLILPVPTSCISLIAKDRLFDSLDLEDEFVVVVTSVASLLNVESRLERLNL